VTGARQEAAAWDGLRYPLFVTSLVEGWRVFRRDRLAVAGLVIIIIMALVALLAPWISPFDPAQGIGRDRLLPPFSGYHILGTDGQGRDILTRLIWGAHVSLVTGIVPTAAAFAASIVLGLLAGFYQRWVGHLIMRLLDVILAFPLVLLGVAMVSVLGPGMLNVMISLFIVEIPYMTRIVYTETSLLRSREFVLAAKVSGSNSLQIQIGEILPNVLSTLIVYSTTIIGSMIVLASGFSFLGIGIQPPTADWGIMTSDGRLVLAKAPHVAAIPGIAIALAALAFTWIGDGLRDALDPRSRRGSDGNAKERG
jgi:peptide/nickel transport system permease protein